MNPEPEKQKDDEKKEQQPEKEPQNVMDVEDVVERKLKQLRPHLMGFGYKAIESQVTKIMGMYINRIDTKKEIIAALKSGKRGPMETSLINNKAREKRIMGSLKLKKTLSLAGRKALKEMVEALDKFREEKQAELDRLDTEIKNQKEAAKDRNLESKAKEKDLKQADEIRAQLGVAPPPANDNRKPPEDMAQAA